MWLIFSVALSSAAQQCDSVIHIKCIFSYSFFMWFNTEYWIQFLMLYSRTLLFFIPLFPQLPVLHSPHPSSWQPHVLALFGFGWTLTSPAAEKTPWYLPKEGNKTKNCAGFGYCGGVTGKGSCLLVCVSDSPRILKAAAMPPLKSTGWVHLQRSGSWVTSSWGCISRSLIEEMTGLAWHGQCKCLEWFRNQ